MLPFHLREGPDVAPTRQELEGGIEGTPPYFYDASLLFRRMALNRIARAELANSDPLLFRELQAFCALCRSKDQCVVDLAHADHDSSEEWHEYCPNATTLAALGARQGCGVATQH
jgi:hypothetical protein